MPLRPAEGLVLLNSDMKNVQLALFETWNETFINLFISDEKYRQLFY